MFCGFGRSFALSRITRILQFTRGIFSITGKWPEKLDRQVCRDIENYWKNRLHDVDVSINKQASSVLVIPGVVCFANKSPLLKMSV